MRELSLCELNHISAGLNCIDPKTFKRMQDTAIGHGILYSIVTGAVFGSIAFGVTVNPITAAVAALAVAPYAAGYGYFHSSTWNLFADNE